MATPTATKRQPLMNSVSTAAAPSLRSTLPVARLGELSTSEVRDPILEEMKEVDVQYQLSESLLRGAWVPRGTGKLNPEALLGLLLTPPNNNKKIQSNQQGLLSARDAVQEMGRNGNW